MKRVIRKNGNLIFDIDGKEVYPAAYMSYCPNDADFEGFKALGYKLFSYCVYTSDITSSEQTGLLAGWDDGCWVNEDRFDFTALDRGMSRLLSDNPDELYVILRINLNMPRWWREKYPDELIRYNDGKTLMQSVWSKQWRQDAVRFLDALKAHIEGSSYSRNIIAWQVAAMNTEEWMHPIRRFYELEQDKPWEKAFIAEVTQKYECIEALNSAWKTEYASFSEIGIPSVEEMLDKRNNGKNAAHYHKVIDYYKTLNDGYAEAAIYFTRYVKKLFDGDILCGAFYGYIGASSDIQGHCSVSRLLTEPSIDFFASPFAYVNARGMGVDWIYHSPVASADRNGKIWFLESDVRTSLTRHLRETRPELFPGDDPYFDLPVFFGPDTVKQSKNNMLRSFSKFFISGHAYWWFDMWGGWYKNDEYMSLIKRLYDIYNTKMQAEVKPTAEIAVIMDENAAYCSSGSAHSMGVYKQLIELGYLGASYDNLLLDDVRAEDIKKYKLFIILCPDTESDSFKQLEAMLKCSHKAMLITGSSEGAVPHYKHDDIAKVAENAGVHIYSPGNIVYANERYIAVTAAKDGVLTLNLPQNQTLRNMLTDEVLTSNGGKVYFEVEFNDCNLFEIS